MDEDRKPLLVKLIIAVIVLVVLVLLFFSPAIIKAVNKWDAANKAANNATSYEVLQQVENTCRSMIASYNSDKLTYEQYKDATDDYGKQLADQAKMRANKTASEYNNYMLKNNYVWKDDIPIDINNELEIIN